MKLHEYYLAKNLIHKRCTLREFEKKKNNPRVPHLERVPLVDEIRGNT